MLRTISTAERRLTPNGAAPVNIPDSASTVIIPDQTVKPTTEIAYRYIQNTGNVNLYYAFGQNCTNINYHGILAPMAQLDCSAHRLSVSGYAVGGTTAAVTILYRNDLNKENSFAVGQQG